MGENNVYSKYTANVFLAKCPERHERDEIITMTTRHGAEHEVIVFNLIYEKDGYFFYSAVRADGFNVQEYARRKAERYQEWAGAAEKKSDEYYEASSEGSEFLRLAEPIKVGHHSEKRHRALIERNWNRMEKSVEYSKKAKMHEEKSEYWENRMKDVNLSMPESVEYFEKKLEKAKEAHRFYLENPDKRGHSYSLAYAKKDVNEMQRKYDLAVKLWG